MKWFKKIFGDSFSDPSAVGRDVREPKKPKPYKVIKCDLTATLETVTLRYRKVDSIDTEEECNTFLTLSNPYCLILSKVEFETYFPQLYEEWQEGEIVFGSYSNKRHESGLYSTYNIEISFKFDTGSSSREFDYDKSVEFLKSEIKYTSDEKYSLLERVHTDSSRFTSLFSDWHYKDTPKNKKMLDNKDSK